MDEKLGDKLRILADAAKYDASCASSGATKRAAGREGLGSTSNGICHAYTPDGRCVSLLKILLTNYCLYDCAYCINRRSSNVPRARFAVQEVVDLTIAFYKRNYIEGLFLSSGIIRTPTTRWSSSCAVREDAAPRARLSRLHPPEDDPGGEPVADRAGGLYADRLSINIELPTRREPAAAGAGEGCRRRSDAPWARMRERHREARAPRPELLARRPVDAARRRRRRARAMRDPAARARRSIATTICGASTIRPSARSRTQAGPSR